MIFKTKAQNLKNLKYFYFKNNINAHVFSYTNHLYKIIKECDFVITRSGASALGELINLNIPFISIPLPTSADDHQLKNAEFYEKKGYGYLIKEKEEISKKLKELGVEESLINLKGITQGMLVILGQKNI